MNELIISGESQSAVCIAVNEGLRVGITLNLAYKTSVELNVVIVNGDNREIEIVFAVKTALYT